VNLSRVAVACMVLYVSVVPYHSLEVKNGRYAGNGSFGDSSYSYVLSYKIFSDSPVRSCFRRDSYGTERLHRRNMVQDVGLESK
jgi:hypothetical protein